MDLVRVVHRVVLLQPQKEEKGAQGAQRTASSGARHRVTTAGAAVFLITGATVLVTAVFGATTFGATGLLVVAVLLAIF